LKLAESGGPEETLPKSQPEYVAEFPGVNTSQYSSPACKVNELEEELTVYNPEAGGLGNDPIESSELPGMAPFEAVMLEYIDASTGPGPALKPIAAPVRV